MTRRSKTKQWYKQHQKDPYVQQAQKQGLRSRACFKLDEIQKKYRFIHKQDVVVDLGAAPGSWSQACLQFAPYGQIIAIDLLAMAPIANIDILQGDFTDATMQAQLLALAKRPMQVVISDMSPNHTGIKKVDQWRAHALNEQVLVFCASHLAEGGHCLMKVFHSGDFHHLTQTMRQQYQKVHIIKPKASRDQSSEVFMLGMGHLPQSIKKM